MRCRLGAEADSSVQAREKRHERIFENVEHKFSNLKKEMYRTETRKDGMSKGKEEE